MKISFGSPGPFWLPTRQEHLSRIQPNVGPSISLKYSAEAFPSLCCPPGFDREIDQQLFVVVRSAYYNRFIGAVFLILDKALNRFVETVEALPQ
jgi:hypothetical protein